MTTHGTALLAAILADPADDSARLVYADWLEENGEQERAEFVRVQLTLASEFPLGTPCERDPHFNHGFGRFANRCRCRPCSLRRKEYMVSRRHLFVGWQWGLLPGAAFIWRRGFIAEIRCTCQSWLDHGPAIVRAQPIERVELVGKRPEHVEREPGFPCWTWFLSEAIDDRPHHIPNCFWHHARQTWWASEEGALKGLSAAALAWAKAQPAEVTT